MRMLWRRLKNRFKTCRDASGKSRDQRGFTLPEVLTVVSIIGVLSSVGMVSYESARVKARDVKRAADAAAIQQALELYYENHGNYPGIRNEEGIELGTPQTAVLSDGGFSSTPTGNVYIVLPTNPGPGGSPYTYRGLA